MTSKYSKHVFLLHFLITKKVLSIFRIIYIVIDSDRYMQI